MEFLMPIGLVFVVFSLLVFALITATDVSNY